MAQLEKLSLASVWALVVPSFGMVQAPIESDFRVNSHGKASLEASLPNLGSWGESFLAT